MNVSPYLLLPLRTLEQALKDRAESAAKAAANRLRQPNATPEKGNE